MKIVGFDPGTARVGWGIIIFEYSKITQFAYGCFESSKNEKEAQRLLEIFNNISHLLKQHKPDAVSIEEIFFSKNVSTAIPVSQARGVILLACASLKIPVVSYSPRAVKRTITGDGNADKLQMQSMIRKLLKLSFTPKPDDAADAIAIALTHAYTQKIH